MKTIILLLILHFSLMSFAQSSSSGKTDASINEIEGLFEETAEEDEQIEARRTRRVEKRSSKRKKIKKFSDLKNLETFDDIAVIQKRYLPKTKRFEFFIGAGTNLNDAFFVGNGINARLGYYLTERWGLEGNFSYIQNDNRDVTNELLERGVNTEGMVATEQFYGIDLKWNPIYGKYAYFNQKIIPFDLYFSLGLGMTTPKIGNSENNQNFQADNVLTYKFGTGQIFAITKWMAFRWDLSWHFFEAKSSIQGGASLHNNLFLNLGLSFFFPEANYR